MAGTDRSTLEWLARHATERPQAPAFVLDGRPIGFGAFHTALCRTTGFLRRLELSSGNVAALDCDDPVDHVLLALGCEALGIATASIDGRARDAYGSLQRIADILISAAPARPSGYRRVERLAPDWQRRLPDGPPLSMRPCDPDVVMRLLQTSGTTGPVKWMRATQRSQGFWLAQYRRRSGMTAKTRHLMVSAFHLNAAYLYATACLRAGGCCLIETQRDLAAAVVALRPNHMAVLPTELGALMEGVAAARAAVAPMDVATLGARIGPALRRRAAALFGRSVMESYGSNETGPIATMDAEGVGTLLPGVSVSIVDEAGLPVPPGRPGLLRVRSAGVVDGYVEAPAATAAAFHDGWFQPGDLAVDLGDGRIRLLGRADDMLNIGGVKLSPLAFEEAARGLAVLRDLCVVERATASGLDELAIAVVLAPGAEPDDAVRQLGPLFPKNWGPATLHVVAAIPRTGTGKPVRAALRALLGDRRGLAPVPDS